MLEVCFVLFGLVFLVTSSWISRAVTEEQIGAEYLEDKDGWNMILLQLSCLLVLSMLRRRMLVKSRRNNLGRSGGRRKDA